MAALRKKAEKGVTQFLATFYFRQSEYIRGENPLFEFTHKSFREYLTAKTIVRLLSTIHEQLKTREKNSDIGWDEKFSLIKFVELFGPSPLDDYLLTFVKNELKLGPEESLVELQKTLRRLLEYSLKNCLPMEEIKGADRYGKAVRWARNAEEALLVLLNSCTCLIPQTMTSITWPDQNRRAFVDLLSRLGRHPWFALENLFSMDLNGCDLGLLNLVQAVMARSNLASANLSFTNLFMVDLSEANLSYANLSDANLASADVSKADLSKALLSYADLTDANLSGAKLSGARLSRADLTDANLSGAKLSEAEITDTLFSESQLSQAIFSRSNSVEEEDSDGD